MALDGLVLANVVHELQTSLVGGRIDKIYQTEKEDILITMRNQGNSYKLLLTANSNYPRLHLSTLTKNNNQEPPMFCMLLRKHLGGGKLLEITQPDMERIVCLSIEATNELGDKEIKQLVIEIMGRHSNIILMKQDGTIIDSIKHISLDKSSVREVLPNRTYIRPPSGDKLNPLTVDETTFIQKIQTKELPLFKALYTSFNGLSPVFAQNLCCESHLDSSLVASTLSTGLLGNLFASFNSELKKVKEAHFSPTLYLDEKELPSDFYCFNLVNLESLEHKHFDSMSALLEHFYFERSTHFNVSQKTGDIKKLLHTFLDRSVRKKQIQEKALEEAAHKDLYKIYGELITAYAFQVDTGSTSFTTLNYYEEPYEEITIPLESHLSAIENAQAYYKLYTKAKRTELAAKEQLDIIEEDIKYLQSVLLSLDLLETKEDIDELRSELIEMGYLKKRKGVQKGKSNKKELPYLHFKSTEGHDIYVGKNNYQNDSLTMKFAKPNDLWLHIKDGPGSHVIIKSIDGTPISEEITLEGAMLAAYYSSGKMSSHVPIDYTYKKYVKKIPNAKPGMVIYTNFKTLYVTPTESFVKKLANN
ncbi:MAG: NFACT family protein [Cellulosilyticum sp.]|nr:NFACT family protein [Cellulosilyticum sp.]